MGAVPIIVKGGAWTQTEDQILKAGVSKYGLHKWNKIASLLTKKTGLQCKNRWEQYLNPQLNFQNFTPEEDSRLLDLIRSLPNQWQTIGDIMKRPVQSCIDRYQLLLDKNNTTDGKHTSVQVGDYNINAESLPAKRKLDDDDNANKEGIEEGEREMIAEAKARILGSQGKKASRKSRERMLEESKRVALLQKRRELKQAGINTTLKKPKKKYDTELDYNAEIPYEHKPLAGRYNTTLEDEKDILNKVKFEKNVNRFGLKEDDEDEFINTKQDINTKDNHSTGNRSASHKQSANVKQIQGLDKAFNEYKKPKLDLPKPGEPSDIYEQIKQNRELLLSKLGKSSVWDINGEVASNDKVSNIHTISSSIKQNLTILRKKINILFQGLPKPENDFQIVAEPDINVSKNDLPDLKCIYNEDEKTFNIQYYENLCKKLIEKEIEAGSNNNYNNSDDDDDEKQVIYDKKVIRQFNEELKLRVDYLQKICFEMGRLFKEQEKDTAVLRDNLETKYYNEYFKYQSERHSIENRIDYYKKLLGK
ncbi:uncharacterized protein SCODWIG_03058 [Saccharomycodes ludwigii]|uniref:Pre-mRNA-splicing factor CEF1 n=1 Tax=Saccharomycodes ludwigii TaxID=36035 RepID=A0A376B9G0_9ASCO|nr:hypothetical protein SCDLUD_002214 [Saccharomycodes ludwigii]KAH3902393.1 hypothetical protein SCDLUD_002214 [Saccharomycodes ludwigii]SSD61297.1 uncharacterized protein SCODWIG_03058 [Saccharomycodes ludwigii]